MQGKAVRFHRAAEQDIEQAFEWYRERSEEAAANFLREVTEVVEKITDAPERWPVFHFEARKCSLRHFPYMIVYRERNSYVEILAVAHSRRKPGFWLARAIPE